MKITGVDQEHPVNGCNFDRHGRDESDGWMKMARRMDVREEDDYGGGRSGFGGKPSASRGHFRHSQPPRFHRRVVFSRAPWMLYGRNRPCGRSPTFHLVVKDFALGCCSQGFHIDYGQRLHAPSIDIIFTAMRVQGGRVIGIPPFSSSLLTAVVVYVHIADAVIRCYHARGVMFGILFYPNYHQFSFRLA